MKKLLALIGLVLLTGTSAHALEFDPNFGIGVGFQHSVNKDNNDDKDDSVNIGAKVFLFRGGNGIIGYNLIGLGAAYNFEGYGEILLSPINLRLFNFLSIAPEYGVSLSHDHPDTLGLSVSLGF